MCCCISPLKEMVDKAELAEFFRDAPEDVLEFIAMLGTERDLRYAHFLPFNGQIDALWTLIQEQLSDAGKSPAAGRPH